MAETEAARPRRAVRLRSCILKFDERLWNRSGSLDSKIDVKELEMMNAMRRGKKLDTVCCGLPHLYTSFLGGSKPAELYTIPR